MILIRRDSGLRRRQPPDPGTRRLAAALRRPGIYHLHRLGVGAEI